MSIEKLGAYEVKAFLVQGLDSDYFLVHVLAPSGRWREALDEAQQKEKETLLGIGLNECYRVWEYTEEDHVHLVKREHPELVPIEDIFFAVNMMEVE